MSLRLRLVLAFAAMLALFAVNQAVQLRSDSQRTQTMTTLDRALKRQILMAEIRRRTTDLQRQMALLSQIDSESNQPPPGREIVTADINAVSTDIASLLDLTDGDERPAVVELQRTYAQLAEDWSRFYDYFGSEAGWATAFQVKAEPLAAALIKQIHGLQADQSRHVQEAQARFDAISRTTRRFDLAMFAVSMLASLVIVFFLARYVTSRLAELNRGVTAIATMDLEHRIRVHSHDELGQVGAAFNTMAENLAGSRRELKQANQELLARNGEIERQRERAESLLLNILPADIAAELAERGEVAPRYFEDVTIVFTDFVGFTAQAERLAAEDVIGVLHHYFKQFDDIAARYELEKLKTVGDSYFCVAGLPRRTPSHPVDATLAALEMLHAVSSVTTPAGDSWSVRIGLHAGPVVAGVVGTRKFAFDVWGDTVNLASRMETAAGPNRINVSAAMNQRLKDFFAMEARGRILTKEGKDLEMFEVVGVLPALLAGDGRPPDAFARRYRTYFDKPVTAFPAFLGHGTTPPAAT